jgi:hypothetical protein
MTCGLGDLLSPINYPPRYIEREVSRDELVGTWEVTSESESRINAYFQKQKETSALAAPWKSISLNSNGSCEVDLEISWSLNNDVLKELDALPTCTWKIDTTLGYDENGMFKDVPSLLVRFEHFNVEADLYHVYYSESFIVEENNELILWNFIGGSSFLRYQDFKKINK